MNQKKILLGAHVSIAGGFDKAIIRGEEIGANCIQFFTKSNRQWNAAKISSEAAQLFIETKKKSTIQVVIAHAAYLINLGSANHVAQKSKAALKDELLRCEMLQIPYLVLHPGTYANEDKTHATLLQVATIINEIFNEIELKHTMLLLETMAGQGSVIGKTFEEIATILQYVQHKKHIGVCIDTCHIFAAGYDFQNKTSYHQMWKLFDDLIGIQKLKVIHVNDSKKDQGALIDRHEHIGQGKITSEAFALLMQDSKLTKIPKILETPKDHNELESDKKNIATLLKYAQQKI